MSDAIRILQLYPDELGVTGDAGNVLAVATRLRLSGHQVVVEAHRPGDPELGTADLAVIGNGPLSAVRRILPDARAHRDELAALVTTTPTLAVGTGLELLGRTIHAPDGDVDSLGILGFTAWRGRPRRVGYAIARGTDGEVVGFEDQGTELSDVERPFVTIVRDVSGEVSRPDGVRTDTLTGTLLQGPLLPLNPAMANRLAAEAARHAGRSFNPGERCAELDHDARRATERMRANVGMRFTTIQ